MLPIFASKLTFARIDFLRQGERLVDKKALIMLNLLLKTVQNELCRKHARVGNDTENM